MSNSSNTAVDNKFEILLAEDEPASQILIERFLNMAGHNVTIANNGQEALDYLSNNSFALCIFDMQMPEMNGIEAVESYKNTHPKSKLPFIMLTANIEKDAIEKCKKAGADIHLAKPIIYKTLIETVNNTIGIRLVDETSSDSIIDLTQLDQFEDPVFLDKFIKLFENSADQLIENLSNALDNSYDSFMIVIHSIKGLSGNVGAKVLREITIKAEGLSNDDYKKNSGEYYKKIVDELSRVRGELIKFSNNK